MIPLVNRKETNKKLINKLKKQFDKLDLSKIDINISGTPEIEEYINFEGKGERFIYNEIVITIKYLEPKKQKIDKMKGMY